MLLLFAELSIHESIVVYQLLKSALLPLVEEFVRASERTEDLSAKHFYLNLKPNLERVLLICQ